MARAGRPGADKALRLIRAVKAVIFDEDWEYLLMQLLLRKILDNIATLQTTASEGATAALLAVAQVGISALVATMTTTTKVIPTLAAGVDCTTSASAFTLGSAATLAATNAIPQAFTVIGFNIDVNSLGAGEYAEVVLYTAGVEFARARVNVSNVGFQYISMYGCAANSAITAKAACSTANARVLKLSLSYI